MVKRRSGAVVWFTGLSGAGKSTIAQEVCRRLACQDVAVECLDGDVVRGIFPATGFSRADRDTHIRRIGYMASRLEYHVVIVVAALISSYRASRDFVRGLCENFVEVFVSTPLEVCEARDVKGVYARARNGEIRQFTGIDDPYEPPAWCGDRDRHKRGFCRRRGDAGDIASDFSPFPGSSRQMRF